MSGVGDNGAGAPEMRDPGRPSRIAFDQGIPVPNAGRLPPLPPRERDRVLVERNWLRERVIDLEGICERALRWGLDGHERYSAEDSGRTGNDMRSLMTTKETPRP